MLNILRCVSLIVLSLIVAVPSAVHAQSSAAGGRAEELLLFCATVPGACDSVLDIQDKNIGGRSFTTIGVKDSVCAAGGPGEGMAFCQPGKTSVACLLDPAGCDLPPICKLIGCAPGCPLYGTGDCPQPNLTVVGGFEGDGVTDPPPVDQGFGFRSFNSVRMAIPSAGGFVVPMKCKLINVAGPEDMPVECVVRPTGLPPGGPDVPWPKYEIVLRGGEVPWPAGLDSVMAGGSEVPWPRRGLIYFEY